MDSYKYYDKLVKETKIYKKTELEIYRNISMNVDEILANDSEQDKMMLLKSLITYGEGRLDNSWYIGIMQIIFAVLMCAICIIPNIPKIDDDDMYKLVIVLIICCGILLLDRKNNPYIGRKMVLCVLYDKLNEISRKQNDIDNTLKTSANTQKPKYKKSQRNRRKRKKHY